MTSVVFKRKIYDDEAGVEAVLHLAAPKMHKMPLINQRNVLCSHTSQQPVERENKNSRPFG